MHANPKLKANKTQSRQEKLGSIHQPQDKKNLGAYISQWPEMSTTAIYEHSPQFPSYPHFIIIIIGHYNIILTSWIDQHDLQTWSQTHFLDYVPHDLRSSRIPWVCLSVAIHVGHYLRTSSIIFSLPELTNTTWNHDHKPIFSTTYRMIWGLAGYLWVCLSVAVHVGHCLRTSSMTNTRKSWSQTHFLDYVPHDLSTISDHGGTIPFSWHYSRPSCVKLVQWNVYFWRLLCGTAVNQCTAAVSLRSKLIYRLSHVFEKLAE